jgi:hypothetical protein
MLSCSFYEWCFSSCQFEFQHLLSYDSSIILIRIIILLNIMSRNPRRFWSNLTFCRLFAESLDLICSILISRLLIPIIYFWLLWVISFRLNAQCIVIPMCIKLSIIPKITVVIIICDVLKILSNLSATLFFVFHKIILSNEILWLLFLISRFLSINFNLFLYNFLIILIVISIVILLLSKRLMYRNPSLWVIILLILVFFSNLSILNFLYILMMVI